MKVMVTGGCGFIGHHFIEHILKNTDWEIVVVDKLTYASMGLARIKDINVYDEKRFEFFSYDIKDELSYGLELEISKDVNYIFHLAAETHVDRSIENPEVFVKTNVLGTMHMLNFARECKNLKGFLYFSTDEVFGPADDLEQFEEWDRYNCTNPYAATKAGGEELALSYANTYGLPVFVTHTMNCFGERQHPEKYIPKTIKKILKGEVLTVHGDKGGRPGSRFYIHCRNVADAILYLIDQKRFEVRQKYNIVGEKEIDNLCLAQKIAEIMNKPLVWEMVDYHSSRPGHDLRYALDGNKMKGMGWEAPMSFEESLEKSINWMLENEKWLEL